MEPYADSVDHLRAELSRLDALLHRALVIARMSATVTPTNDLRGLVITEREIDGLARAADYLGEHWRQEEATAGTVAPLDDRAEALRHEIEGRVEASRCAGVYLALPFVSGQFGLTRPELDLLLTALAPEVEPRYETVFAYLQNDVTRKRPSVDLALNLISRSDAQKLRARQLLTPAAPLLGYRLVTLGEETYDRQPALLRKFLKVEEAVVAAVLDQSIEVISGATLVMHPSAERLDDLEPATSTAIRRLADQLAGRSPNDSVVVNVAGPVSAPSAEAAEAIAALLARRLLIVDLSEIGDPGLLAIAARDARLWNALLALKSDDLDQHAADSRRADLERALWTHVRAFRDVVLLAGAAPAFSRVPADLGQWRIEVAEPGFELRKQLWKRMLPEDVPAADVNRLADSFRFGRDRIAQAVNFASRLSAVGGAEGPPPTTSIVQAGRLLTTARLQQFAVRVEPLYTWPDIVLPPDKMKQLRRLVARMRHRHRVHEDWGFGRKLSRGRGLNVLFSGPPGTGKTMAAEIMSSELSLDLYQIDLSGVVSRFIGETEKNLSAIFAEAERTQALLFFDEADALFGKRTEVKDAHDRYANIEVNYLLQRIDQYEGVVVLATNLQRNLDEAFLGRMQEVVDFLPPSEELRERIWRGHFPDEAKCEAIDFAFLARQFTLNGRSIKSIALDAAFAAAAENEHIGMKHVVVATRAELLKLGRLPLKNDFLDYYELAMARS